MSFILPEDELTLTDIKGFRAGAIAAGLARAQKIMGRGPTELVVRQLLNITDCAAALEQWNTAALAVVGTEYSVFQAAGTVTLANNKLLVIYGVTIETLPCPVSRLIIRSGAATGNILAEFDLEQIICSNTLEGYFNQPICLDPTQVFAVNVRCRIATGVLARIQLKNFLLEPIGQFIA